MVVKFSRKTAQEPRGDGFNALGFAFNVLLSLLPGGALGGILGGIASNIALSPVELGLSIAIVVLVGLAFCFAFWQRKSYRSYHYPRAALVSDYIVNMKKVSYSLDDGCVRYAREMDITARRPQLRSTTDRYIWTGPVKPVLDSHQEGRSGISEITYKNVIGIWQLIEIDFDRILGKRDRHRYRYEWPPLEDYRESAPFIGASTDYPTKELVMTVTLGHEFAGQVCFAEEMRDIGGMVFKTTEMKFDDHGHVEWAPEKVKRFRYYRLRWTWDKSIPDREP